MRQLQSSQVSYNQKQNGSCVKTEIIANEKGLDIAELKPNQTGTINLDILASCYL